MLLKIKGKSIGIQAPVVGKVSFIYDSSSDIWIVDRYNIGDLDQCRAVLCSSHVEECIFDKPGVYSVPTFDHLSEGDIVVVHSDGTINTLYRIDSSHNFLLLTERCNSNCLMCSQPPKNRDDTAYFYNIYSRLIPLIPKSSKELGITGGEPTLLGKRFFALLEQLQYFLPETEIHCLTNGRSFAWPSFANKLGELKYTRLMLGIPIYADYYAQHDYVVQTKGAFEQTVRGLYNLARNDVRIELRIVLHKQTVPRLLKLAKFIYKNFPFVEHVAFMALENQGYTPHNLDKLWMDPIHYSELLAESMLYLADHGMNVSLYNSQLCITPIELWPFSRQAISDWKNIYLDSCKDCAMKERCGGFFASSLLKHSSGIKPIQQDMIGLIGN